MTYNEIKSRFARILVAAGNDPCEAVDCAESLALVIHPCGASDVDRDRLTNGIRLFTDLDRELTETVVAEETEPDE